MTWAQNIPARANAVFSDRVLRELRKGAETKPGQWKLIRTYQTKKAAVPKHPADIEVRNRYRSAGDGRQVTEVWARAKGGKDA